LLTPHPNLKAVSPQATPANVWRGDDFYTNGAFRLSVGFGYAALMQSGKTPTNFDYNMSDNYEFFRNLMPLSLANEKYFTKDNRKPLWDEFMENEDYNEHWQSRDFTQYIPEPTVATMLVDGWWDAEDFFGIFAIYDKLMSYNKNKDLISLIVGPWYHGQWTNPYEKAESLGALPFDSPTGEYFREEICRSFFYEYLRKPALPAGYVAPRPVPAPYKFAGKVHSFTTGENKWNTFDEWPLSKTKQLQYFLAPAAKLDSAPAKVNTSSPSSCYQADPLRPIPYVPRPIKEFWMDDNAKFLWKILDQRFVDSRPDLLLFTTQVLPKDITLQGAVSATFFATTTGTDVDWIVKLIDVYPDSHPNGTLQGYRLPVADTVLRAKYRNNPSRPEPLVPNQIYEFSLDLMTRSHKFLAGHSIMIQISSSSFPLLASNPQTFVNIPKAKIEDYQIAKNCILHSPQYPSSLSLSVVDE